MNIYKSKYATNASPVYISDRMTGKMEGIPCISTTMQLNPICRERAKDPESICAHCYASRTTKQYKALEAHLEENYKLLTEDLIPGGLLPHLKLSVNMLRFESFGDLATVTQARNYLRIAKVNPHVHCAIWTKNPHILEEAIKLEGKPDNLRVVYSSPHLNDERDVRLRYPHVDHIFTVYTKDRFHEAEGVYCKGQSCAACGFCYFETIPSEIKEELK